MRVPLSELPRNLARRLLLRQQRNAKLLRQMWRRASRVAIM
jgi:hypothetical protein